MDSDEKIKNGTKLLKDISKNGFKKCFEQSYKSWKKYVDPGGKYFEDQYDRMIVLFFNNL